MGRARVALDLPGTPEGAEALWHDLSRWPGFVDGFRHAVKVEGGWPAAGGRLVWDSRPGGRGRVVEWVTACEPGRGQTAEVEDERLRGTQTIAFVPLRDGVEVALELRYALKARNPLTPIVDLLFIRRALADSLRRTVRRLGDELAAES